MVAAGCVPFVADVLKVDEVMAEYDRIRPDVIIHCATRGSIEWCANHYREALHLATWGTSNISDCGCPVLLISSDYVFDGRRGQYKESETSGFVEDNFYGYTKWAAEIAVNALKENRIIRLSKCFGLEDTLPKIEELRNGHAVDEPSFIYRSYLHVDHAVEGILWAAEHIHIIPRILNIAGTGWLSASLFMKNLCHEFGFDEGLVIVRNREKEGETPRPYKLGLNVYEARRRGVPLYSHEDGLRLLKGQYDSLHSDSNV